MFKFCVIRYPQQRDFKECPEYRDRNKRLVWVNDNRRHGKYIMFMTDWNIIKRMAGFRAGHKGPIGASLRCWKRWFFE